MSDEPHLGALFIRSIFGPATTHSVFLTSLPNTRDGGEAPRQVVTRDVSDIARFCMKWDRPGRGLFFCVGTLKPGTTRRAKDNIAEIIGLHGDIDFKSITVDGADALAAIDSFAVKPSIVVRSGNGFHCYWLFRESIAATPENVERVEAALRLLADAIGGDLAVCEISRLMRLPATHNTKNGAWAEVKIVREHAAARYELEDLEEWLSRISPVIHRKAVAGERADTTAGPIENNPFLAVAARFGFKPPIDVERRLKLMAYQGAGDSAIHPTQLQVSASLLSRGTPIEEVVGIICDATRAAAGAYGERWNWRREDAEIRRMCETWQRKNPPPQKNPTKHSGPPSPNPTGKPTLVDLGATRAVKKARVKGNTPLHIMLAQAVLEGIRARGDDLLVTPKAAWRYVDGLWSMATDGLRAWLEVEIEVACRALELESTNRLISETRQLITRNPDLWHETVAWDAHGKIPTRSGLIDPATLELTPPAADQYCTWRVECDYRPDACCPWWKIMLGDLFGDRSADNRGDLIALIAEILGAGLLDTKPRALTKALILQGGSNYGKSEILEVLGGLFGPEQIATGLEALEGAHGLMAFASRLPWVLHEAFDQRKWHFSSIVKAIITGEPVNINIKNGPMLSQRIKAPIFWGANHPPQFRETTKAIVNRLVVIECRREFMENNLIGAAAEAALRGFEKPSSFILATELPGLLNWALAGLRRARKRGFFELPQEVKDTAEEIRRDSNLVAGFLEECVEFTPDWRVSTPDFCAAFSVWWLESKGEDRRLPSNESVGKAVVAMSDPRIAHGKELRDMHRRYYAGFKLNEQGVKFWQRALEGKVFEGKVASTTTTGGEVNTRLPAAWHDKPAIIIMNRSHRQDAHVTCHADDTSRRSCDNSDAEGVSCSEGPEVKREPLF